MVSNDVSTCPKCGGQLKYYDRVERIVRTKGRKTWKIPLRRLRCDRCGAVHRELPELIFPYKQYEAEVIIGVLEGFITCETMGFEDYPCEMTMFRWTATMQKFIFLRQRSFSFYLFPLRDKSAGLAVLTEGEG